MGSKKNIVICRKINETSRKRLEAIGLLVDDFNVVEITFRMEDEMLAIINNSKIPFVFTSKNGIKGILNLQQKSGFFLATKACYCIAPVTRDFALLSGFRPKGEGANALELANCIAENGETRVLHSTSIDRREELYEILNENSIEITSLYTYRKSLKNMDIETSKMAMFFSPSQVDGYLKKRNLESETMAFCVGETTADYLKNKGHYNIEVSKKSTEKSLVDSVIRYCKTNE